MRTPPILLLGLCFTTACPASDPSHPAVDAAADAVVSASDDAMNGAMPDTGPPRTGPAMLRFCHRVGAAEKAPRAVTLAVGDQRLEAPSGGCAPAAASACVAVPEGTSEAVLSAGPGESYSARISLDPGTAYLVWTDVEQIEGQRQLRPYLFELPDAEDCHGLDFREADLRLRPALALEPAQAEEFAFARPRAMVAVPGKDRRHLVFEAPSPDAAISRFEITYLGRLPSSQIPPVGDLVVKAVADRKLTVVGGIERHPHYAAVTVDTGAPGPTRYRRMMFITHNDLLNQEFALLAAEYGKGPQAVDLFTAEVAFPSLTFQWNGYLPWVLKSIAWGIQVPVNPVPSEQLPGIWRGSDSGFPIGDYVDGSGNWVGGMAEGTQLTVKFSPGGTYEMTTIYSSACLGNPDVPCSFNGAITHTSRGRYQAAGGVATFSPWRCESRIYDRNRALASSGYCTPDRIPLTLRMGRSDSGSLLLGGLGIHPLLADHQWLRWIRRTDGPPGDWNVPWLNPITGKDPWAGRIPMDRFDVCGLPAEGSESEYNDTPQSATPVMVGVPLAGCAPTYFDKDHYLVTAPETSSGQPGYFQATVTPVGRGRFSADLESAADGRSMLGIGGTSTEAQAAPLRLYWAGAPGQQYRFSVHNRDVGWFRYDVVTTFTPVVDPHEPNDTPAQARPMALATPVRGLFFSAPKRTTSGLSPYLVSEQDWFAFDLQPGPATVTLADVPAEVRAELLVLDPAGTRVYGEQPYQNGVGLTARITVPAAGTYKISAGMWCGPSTFDCQSPRVGVKAAGDGPLPSSFTNAYLLSVTQP